MSPAGRALRLLMRGKRLTGRVVRRLAAGRRAAAGVAVVRLGARRRALWLHRWRRRWGLGRRRGAAGSSRSRRCKGWRVLPGAAAFHDERRWAGIVAHLPFRCRGVVDEGGLIGDEAVCTHSRANAARLIPRHSRHRCAGTLCAVCIGQPQTIHLSCWNGCAYPHAYQKDGRLELTQGGLRSQRQQHGEYIDDHFQ